MTFDWGYVVRIGPQMMRAAITTLEVALLSMLVAAVLGLFVAAARRSRIRIVSRSAWAYTELLRSTPVLIQIYYVFFVLPNFGLTLSTFLVGILGLGVYYSTFTAEVYRAGLESVPAGQWEAAVALNMTTYRAMRSVILPQAIPVVIPPLGNYLIEMFKATPILATIGMHELLGQGQQMASDTFRYAEVYVWIGAIFLGLSYPSSLVIRWLEGRLSLSARIARGIAEWERPVV